MGLEEAFLLYLSCAGAILVYYLLWSLLIYRRRKTVDPSFASNPLYLGSKLSTLVIIFTLVVTDIWEEENS
jgi:hypothetical protein